MSTWPPPWIIGGMAMCFALGGCGSSAEGDGAPSSGPSSDGGAEAGDDARPADDSGADDVTQDDVFDATVDAPAPSPIDQYCANMAAHDAQCGKATPCDHAKELTCETTFAALSDFMLTAMNDCFASVKPDCGSNQSMDACIAGKMQSPAFSPANDAILSDFCFWCTLPGQTPTDCRNAVGMMFVQYSDAYAADVVSQCPSPSADAGAAQCQLVMDCWAQHPFQPALPPECVDAGP